MKKLLNILAGAGIYYLFMCVFGGYGHTETHVPLNTAIGLRFLEMVNNKSVAGYNKFVNYEFNWNNDLQPDLVGPALTDDYYTYYTESNEADKAFTPLKWIAAGGWMEDEPWGPASISHFYDPKGIDNGKKYLTDNSGKAEWLISIPKEWFTIDAKSWATSANNRYSWTKAKEYVVSALKEPNLEIRKNLMAKAYRSLGQALHLVSDMGCTPHVRNDSHPPKISFLVGDPDPYEDICKKLDPYTLSKANPPSPGLKSQFENTERFDEIFEAMALYTNSKFYSGGTIDTDRYKPSIRPNNPYPSPLAGEDDYNATEYTYYKTYDGVKVKMCKDKVPVPFAFLFGRDSTRGRPYLDYDCVNSMASVLMPDVVEAGANVIRLFVPSLKMEITKASLDSGGIVRGMVYYSLPALDDEFSGMFDLKNTYNGPVSLFVNGSDAKIAVNAKNNVFEFKLDGKLNDLKEGDKVMAKLEFGGIVLKSEEKKIGVSGMIDFIKSKKYIYINFNADAYYGEGETHCIYRGDGCPGFWSDNYDQWTYVYYPISWSGNNFNLSRHYTNPPEYEAFSYDYTVTGTLDDEAKIASMQYTYHDSNGMEYSFKVGNVKITDFYPDPDNPALGSVRFHLVESDPGSGTLTYFQAQEPWDGGILSVVKGSFGVYIIFQDEGPLK